MVDFDLYTYLNADSQHQLIWRNLVTEKIVLRNNSIYLPGQTLNAMYEIVNGAVKLGSYDEHGEEGVYDVLAEGDFFGNLKYLDGRFFEFSRAVVDTRLRVYPLSFFKQLIVEDHTVSEWFNYYVVKRWSEAETKLFKSRGKVKDKIKYLINHFDRPIHDANGKGFQLMNTLTKKDIGDLIGSTRQTVANALKKIHKTKPDTAIQLFDNRQVKHPLRNLKPQP